MSSQPPPPAGVGPTPALLAPRRLIMLPFTDLLINQITDQKFPITPTWQPVLALGYGLGPNEPRVFRTDDGGSLQVTMAGQGLPGKVAIGRTSDGLEVATNDWTDATTSKFGLAVIAQDLLYNGATGDRARSASALNLGNQTSLGAALSAPPGEWSVQNAPAVSNKATISQAAGGAGVRNICTGFGFGFSAGVAVAATTIVVNLRDGATGVGGILKSWQFSLPAAIIAPFGIEVAGCEIVGSVATAMTLEFTALLANLLEYVNLAGHLAS